MKSITNNKGKENIIGKVIYGFLMFAPLFAIGSSVLITTFNKNVKEEFSYKETIHPETLLANRTYHWSNTETVALYDLTWSLSSLENINTTVNVTEYGADWKGIIFNPNYMTIYNGTAGLYGDFKGSFDFSLALNQTIPEELQTYITYDEVITKPTELKDTFYTAVDKVEESKLFKWAKNNEIYNVINQVANELSIETTFIPMLLTYWLIISIIYFIYDIVLMILNIVHKKIHELQDSI